MHQSFMGEKYFKTALYGVLLMLFLAPFSPAYAFTAEENKGLVNDIYNASYAFCFKEVFESPSKDYGDMNWAMDNAEGIEKCMEREGFPIKFEYKDTISISPLSAALAKVYFLENMEEIMAKKNIQLPDEAGQSTGNVTQSSAPSVKYLYRPLNKQGGKQPVRPLWLR